MCGGWRKVADKLNFGKFIVILRQDYRFMRLRIIDFLSYSKRSMTTTRSSVSMDTPACERNKIPILETLLDNKLFDIARGKDKNKQISCVEFAAGSGCHATFLTNAFLKAGYNITSWQPTDPDSESRANCDSLVTEKDLANIIKPSVSLLLDDSSPSSDEVYLFGGPGSVDIIYACNLLHISPWTCTTGFFSTASALLSENGFVFVYGPFLDPKNRIESNYDFNLSLKERNAEWGVRTFDSVIATALHHNLDCYKKIQLPSNNVGLVFQRRPNIEHDEANSKFVMGNSYIEYTLSASTLNILHTFTAETDRGQGIAAKITQRAFQYATQNNLKVIPTCSYVETYVSKNPEYRIHLSYSNE